MTCPELNLIPDRGDQTIWENMRRIRDYATAMCTFIGNAGGIAGPVGPAGPPGAAGAAGAAGSTGSAGPLGPAVFFAGDPGEDGEPGAPGPQGIAGDPGALLPGSGSSVSMSWPGDQGDEGWMGFPGLNGLNGLAGKDADPSDLECLWRKFRLLLKAWLTTGLPPPIGLEDDYEVALESE